MKFKIEESYQGYVRGTRTMIVDADSLEAAKAGKYMVVNYVSEDHDRDDTESEIQSVEEMKDARTIIKEDDDHDITIALVEEKMPEGWVSHSIELNNSITIDFPNGQGAANFFNILAGVPTNIRSL